MFIRDLSHRNNYYLLNFGVLLTVSVACVWIWRYETLFLKHLSERLILFFLSFNCKLCRSCPIALISEFRFIASCSHALAHIVQRLLAISVILFIVHCCYALHFIDTVFILLRMCCVRFSILCGLCPIAMIVTFHYFAFRNNSAVVLDLIFHYEYCRI